jgi:hypothetical protein
MTCETVETDTPAYCATSMLVDDVASITSRERRNCDGFASNPYASSALVVSRPDDHAER